MYASISEWKELCSRRNEVIEQLKRQNMELTDSISRIRKSFEQEKREFRREAFDIEFEYKQKIKDLTSNFDTEKLKWRMRSPHSRKK